MSLHGRRLAGALAAATCALTAVATLPATAGPGGKPGRPADHFMDIQILSFNDFHGNLEPPSGSSGRVVVDHAIDPETGMPANVNEDVGGVEYLATHLAEARKGHPNSLTVAAGDLIGATPLLSAAFHDEPTIEAMNKLGLDVSAVGNHEFDEGYRELQRMQYGGCLNDGDGKDNQNSCPDGDFAGADFDYLAANVKETATGETILPSYAIKNVNGARIGFIGMTLEGTPDIVTAAGVQGLEFTDEVETANALVKQLKRQQVKAIVVLIHQGGDPAKQKWTDPETGETYDVDPNYDYTCGGGGQLAASSPILPIAAGLDSEIDLVVSGHTHQPYVCNVKDPKGKDRMVTSASSFGRLFTETNLQYDVKKRDIVRTSVESANMLVSRDVAKDDAMTALIDRFNELVTPIASKVLGTITTDVTRTTNEAGESQLGDLIADAQLADPSVVTNGQEPVVAFMNPGGIRTDLVADQSSYGEATGEVTFGEAFSVQPFNNYLVSMTLTGQQIYDVLTEQVTGANAGRPKVLQVSEGFSYRLGDNGPVDGSVMLDGTPIDKAASYRIVTNNFLAGGGDGFPTFVDGTDVYFGGLDIDAFANYLADVSPYTPGDLVRITR